MPAYSAWAREPNGMRRALLGPEPESMRRWLAFLRIGVGGLYLFAFISKLTDDYPAFSQMLQSFAAHNSLALLKRLLQAWVVPHATIIYWVVLAAELAAGFLLVLGLGTRVVALAAILMQFLYLLAALGSGTVITVANGLFIVALLVIFATAGGWRWSLDEMIVNRR